MYRTGFAKLPLHYGRAPRYLVVRMQKLAKEIVNIIVDEYGPDEFLRRISDPFWFQALGCVLGYDWHSSGVTTVVTGILKNAIVPEEHSIVVCGGKGRASKRTPEEIMNSGEKFGFSDSTIRSIQYASRMSAKVDNTAIQAGYQLYHHALFLTKDRKWAVVQQGMSASDRTARRYHWLSDKVKNFVIEPHNAIVCDVEKERVLNMTAKESEGSRKTSVDIVKENPNRLMNTLTPVLPNGQKPLDQWIPTGSEHNCKEPIDFMSMPRSINWKTMKKLYDFQPKNYEELLAFKGVGPATVRGLALIAEIISGEKPSWTDPVKYSLRLRRQRWCTISSAQKSYGRFHPGTQTSGGSRKNRRKRQDAFAPEVKVFHSTKQLARIEKGATLKLTSPELLSPRLHCALHSDFHTDSRHGNYEQKLAD